MLSYNFLNNYKNWGEGLDKINHEMPWKAEDFRKSLNPNSMEAAIWLVEELEKFTGNKKLKDPKNLPNITEVEKSPKVDDLD